MKKKKNRCYLSLIFETTRSRIAPRFGKTRWSCFFNLVSSGRTIPSPRKHPFSPWKISSTIARGFITSMYSVSRSISSLLRWGSLSEEKRAFTLSKVVKLCRKEEGESYKLFHLVAKGVFSDFPVFLKRRPISFYLKQKCWASTDRKLLQLARMIQPTGLFYSKDQSFYPWL